jgi:hypothetical protein
MAGEDKIGCQVALWRCIDTITHQSPYVIPLSPGSPSMYVSFRPDPPVPPFGTEWVAIGRTLPYGPFQPIRRPIPDNAAQQSFECDPVIWQLWVEFHQKIRPIVTQRFPALEEMPTSDIWRHMVDAQHHLPSLTKFRDRLVDHLGRSGILAVPLAASSWDRWLFVLRVVKRKFPNPAMEGPMHQTKLWVCIVHELSQFYGSCFHSVNLDVFGLTFCSCSCKTPEGV